MLGELVGVEGRAGDEGEDFAGVRVEGDHGADLAGHGLFGGHLDVEVDGEFEVFAGDGEGLAEVAELFAVRVDDDVAGAVGAAEESVVGLLDAGSSDDVAGVVEGVAGVVEHGFGDFTDVADEVGGEAVAGVEAALLVAGFELGEFVAVGGEEGLLVGGDVDFKGDGLVLRGGGEAADGRLDLLDGEVEAGGDEREVEVGVGDLIAQEIAGDGRVVVDEQTAFAVEEAAARGEDGDLADAVGLGEDAVVGAVEDLEAVEADEEDGENGGDDVLRRMELGGGEFFFAAGEAVRGPERGLGAGGRGRGVRGWRALAEGEVHRGKTERRLQFRRASDLEAPDRAVRR